MSVLCDRCSRGGTKTAQHTPLYEGRSDLFRVAVRVRGLRVCGKGRKHASRPPNRFRSLSRALLPVAITAPTADP